MCCLFARGAERSVGLLLAVLDRVCRPSLFVDLRAQSHARAPTRCPEFLKYRHHRSFPPPLLLRLFLHEKFTTHLGRRRENPRPHLHTNRPSRKADEEPRERENLCPKSHAFGVGATRLCMWEGRRLGFQTEVTFENISRAHVQKCRNSKRNQGKK